VAYVIGEPCFDVLGLIGALSVALVFLGVLAAA
jgi:hypothetical protein